MEIGWKLVEKSQESAVNEGEHFAILWIMWILVGGYTMILTSGWCTLIGLHYTLKTSPRSLLTVRYSPSYSLLNSADDLAAREVH